MNAPTRDAMPVADRSHARVELAGVLVVASLLVIARALVPLVFEHVGFDSDQAILGLMGKHLAEGRAFPLFVYGQEFLLGVEAWLMVPVFWILGPTVPALRTSLMLTNVALVCLTILGLVRWGGLRPVVALVPVVFIAFPPPLTARHLNDAAGGNIEPLLYAVLLWFLRHRPFVFGAVLAVGFLNREFAIYGAVVLFLADALRGALWRGAGIRHWLFVLLTFIAVWDGLQALKPYASAYGPGTRGALVGGGGGGEQISNLMHRTRVQGGELPARTAAFFSHHLPKLIGGVAVLDVIGNQGRDWLGWLLGIAIVVGAIRVGWLVLARRGPPVQSIAFSWYLLGVGVMAAVGYIAARPLGDALQRYFLVTLFLPVGAAALWLAYESRVAFRAAIVSLILVWSIVSAVDHWRYWVRYRDQPNTFRFVADAIEARGVHVLEAPYWRAYKLTFMTQERLKISVPDFSRIEEYQALARAQGDNLLRLSEEPCPGGEPVADWYLCPSR